MNRLNVGGLLTQFYGLTEDAEQDMQIMNRCDNLSISWFAYDYRIDLKPWIIKRTYAQKIAGTKMR